MWNPHDLIEAAAEGLARAEERLLAGQEVHGLDSLDEVLLHPVLAAGLRGGGFGVMREQPYPSQTHGRRGEGLASRTERDRCDLVLLPPGAAGLADPVAELVLRAEQASTLFSGAAAPERLGVAPEEAFWMEVKAAGQFAPVDGVPGPNRGYSGLVGRCVSDLRKLSADVRIGAGGVLLVLFTADAATAEHDVGVLVHRCLDRGVGVRSPVLRRVAISDRIGNTGCTLALLERTV